MTNKTLKTIFHRKNFSHFLSLSLKHHKTWLYNVDLTAVKFYNLSYLWIYLSVNPFDPSNAYNNSLISTVWGSQVRKFLPSTAKSRKSFVLFGICGRSCCEADDWCCASSPLFPTSSPTAYTPRVLARGVYAAGLLVGKRGDDAHISRPLHNNSSQNRGTPGRSALAYTFQFIHLRLATTSWRRVNYHVCWWYDSSGFPLRLSYCWRSPTAIPKQHLQLNKGKQPYLKPRQIHGNAVHTRYSWT